MLNLFLQTFRSNAQQTLFLIFLTLASFVRSFGFFMPGQEVISVGSMTRTSLLSWTLSRWPRLLSDVLLIYSVNCWLKQNARDWRENLVCPVDIHLQFPLSSELRVPSSSSSSSAIQFTEAWSSFLRNSAMTLCNSVTCCSPCWSCSCNRSSYFSTRRSFSSFDSFRLSLYESRSAVTFFSFLFRSLISLFKEASAAKCSWKGEEKTEGVRVRIRLFNWNTTCCFLWRSAFTNVNQKAKCLHF